MPVFLLERSLPLTAIRDTVSRLRLGESRLVLISGEAGIGKTSLLAAALDQLPSGSRVLRGACDDLVATNPLGPLREAARGRPLADVLTARAELDDVLAGITAELAHPKGTVLALEDLHWADDATVDVLGYLVRRLDQIRAVVIATYRDDEVGPAHPLQRVLAAATGERARYGCSCSH